jgi:hypothetical protein
VTKAVVCSVCAFKAVVSASKRLLKACCPRSSASIREPLPVDKLESALAVASDCLNDASQALAKLSNCLSKARSKAVSWSMLV